MIDEDNEDEIYDEEVNHEDNQEGATELEEDISTDTSEYTQSPAELQDVKQRVIDEADELRSKINGLTSGLSNSNLTGQAHTHLLEQRKHMQAYLAVLVLRITQDF